MNQHVVSSQVVGERAGRARLFVMPAGAEAAAPVAKGAHVAIPRETDHVHLAGGSRARPFGDAPRAGVLRKNGQIAYGHRRTSRASSRNATRRFRSRNPGPRRRGRACPSSHSNVSAIPGGALRARTILGESRAPAPWIRQRGPSSRSARSALRLPCAGPRDSQRRAAH